jgi:hypothetical protein
MPFLEKELEEEKNEKPVESHVLDREQEARLEQADTHAAGPAKPTAFDPMSPPVASVVQDIMAHWAEAEDAEPGLSPTRYAAAPDAIAEAKPKFETGMAGDFVPDSEIGPSFGGGGGGGGGSGGGSGKPGDPFGDGEPPPNQPSKPSK